MASRRPAVLVAVAEERLERAAVHVVPDDRPVEDPADAEIAQDQPEDAVLVAVRERRHATQVLN